MEKRYLTPREIAESLIKTGNDKIRVPAINLFILGLLAGAYIAFAGVAVNTAAYAIDSTGIARIISGFIFPAGIMHIIIAGGELFTGNTLTFMSFLPHEGKRIKWDGLLKYWGIVYLGNLAGSVLIAFLIFHSGQLNLSDGMLGGFTLKIAVSKSNLDITNAFILGILCNWLVCVAVWMSFGAKDITGKVFGAFFPIMLFIVSGFEHSVANMYYLSAGIFAKTNPDFIENAVLLGSELEKINTFGIKQAVLNNLIPVTMGNITGGCLFVVTAYWFVYIKNVNKRTWGNSNNN